MTATTPAGTATTRPEQRFRRDAVGAIVIREWKVFKRVWRSLMFGSVVEPVVYLLAFGFGFGALVAEVGGIPYLDFMATGSAGIAVLFTGFFPGFINGYFRRKENHLYDGVMSTPTTVAEIVTGEAVWTGIRTAGAAVITLAIAAVFGVDLRWSVVFAPVIGFVGGFGFACLGAAFASKLRSTHQFDFVISGVVVPMFVVAGSFFPLEDAPAWLRYPAAVNPLTHVVDLFRAAAFGVGDATSIAINLAVLGFSVGLSWLLAVRWLRKALVS
ncbi:ABC transporter permease [Euzebya tangerina]|uniref:ABC transporter permease n=1 Tax=Euzebya tangerina TaxID=591198 RepID=UPI0013C2C797|nr:ABC transporter permease [Euzebya tangerina]